MKYFPEEEKDSLEIPENFEQAFFRNPFLTTDLSRTVALKTKGLIDNTDIKILSYIYETKFCTKSQLKRFADYSGIEEDDLNARLEVMFSNTIINKFGFVDEENYKGKLPDDIKVFYCLHDGGKHLLDNFSGEDYINWEAGMVVCHSKIVTKTLISSELYTQFLLASSPLVFHTRRPLYTIKSDRFWGGDDYCLSKGETPYYYICDTFLASEKANTVRNKLRSYESVFSSQIWKRYYVDGGQAPVLIFVTDDDTSAGALAGQIKTYFRFPNGYLITTKSRLLSGVNTPGAFLYYNKEQDCLNPTNLNI